MPAYRNIVLPSRKSRRLSQQEPRNYAEGNWENYDAHCSGRGLFNLDAFNPSPTSSDSTSLISSSESPSKFSSTATSDPLRASHSRHQPESHVRRPPNAFIMFRSEFWAREKQKDHPIERNHRNISRIVSHCWNGLGDEEKARYQALAEERKQLHLLEHPNYKYAPANRSIKTAKKKSNKESKKGDEEEKERCKKLAALVMDGLSSGDIQEVMKDTKKRPRSRHSKVRQHTPRSYCRSFNASLPGVPPSTRELVEGVQLVLSQETPLDTFLNEGFVPTNEIPHLDLSAAKDEQVLSPDFDTSIRPLSYDAIDPQFGFKPAISQFNPNNCFWYKSEGVMSVEEHLTSPLFSDNSILSTNPFEYMVTADRDQNLENGNHHIPLTTMDGIDCALAGCETDMNQYLHFDY